MDIGPVPGTRSIENSTYLSGGNPDTSSNTYGNSLTNGISLIGILVSTLILAKIMYASTWLADKNISPSFTPDSEKTTNFSKQFSKT